MTRLQIGATGRWVGRGFWRRVFGSGPFRMTPVDVAVSDADAEKIIAAAQLLNGYLAGSPPSTHRLGSLANLEDVRPFISVKLEPPAPPV